MKITIVILVSLFLRTFSAQAASGGDCAAPYKNSDILAELVVIETAFRDGSDAQAGTGAARLLSGLDCLTEVLPKALAGRVYRAVGAGLYVSGDQGAGVRWMRTAFEVDEDFSFSAGDFVAGHPVLAEYKKIGREMLPDGAMADGKLPEGKHYLDGRPLYSKMATDDRPHLYQHKFNAVHSTVIEGNDFPDMAVADKRVVVSNSGAASKREKKAAAKAAQKAAKKAAKLAKQEAKAAAKLAKAEAAKVARQEAEAARVAKAEAAEAARQEAEGARVAKAEAAEVARQEAEAARVAKAQAAEAARQEAEAKRIASADATKVAKQKAEADRLAAANEIARATADREAAEAASRAARIRDQEQIAAAKQRDADALVAQKKREKEKEQRALAKRAEEAAQAKAAAKQAKADAKRLAKAKSKKNKTTVQHSNRLGAVVLQRERPVLKTPMLIGGLLVGVGVSGTLYYGAFDARADFNQATTEQEVLDFRSRTNQLLVASGAALAVGSGMYTVGFILSDSGFSLLGRF